MLYMVTNVSFFQQTDLNFAVRPDTELRLTRYVNKQAFPDAVFLFAFAVEYFVF